MGIKNVPGQTLTDQTHILPDWCAESELLAGYGMQEGYFPGMEHLSWEHGVISARPVEDIACHRMPQVGHMHSDLVRTAGFDRHPHLTDAAAVFVQNLPVAGRVPAGLLLDSHLLPVYVMTADRSNYPPLRLRQNAMHQGDIFLFHLARLEGLHKHPVRIRILGCHHHP